MVEDTGGTKDVGSAFLPVNLPQLIQVDTDADGRLRAVWLKGRRRQVLAVRSAWRVDDRWWREVQVSRLYLSILLDEGMVLTVFTDLVTGQWFRQSYE